MRIAAGLAAGVVAGAGVAAGTAHSRSSAVAALEGASPWVEVAHLPPLLTLDGETPRLRYETYCVPAGQDAEAGPPCDAVGTVYLRTGESGSFQPVLLRPEDASPRSALVADVPPSVASAPGFAYYAVIRSASTGVSTMVPPGGPFAPMRSRRLRAPVAVDLGVHVFGADRAASERVASARWGDGPGQVGLEGGPQVSPVGASSFDVGADGAVRVLDEAHRRLLTFPRGGAPVATSLAVDGTIADLRVGDDGTTSVLETVAPAGSAPLLRVFDRSGHARSATPVGDARASALDLGSGGPVVLGYPGAMWLPVTDRGAPLPAAEQRRGGRVGRVVAPGQELVVEREGDEARIAEIGPGGIRRSWRIRSATPLGEIQTARAVGDDVVVVLRVYTDDRDAFEVLVLGSSGLRSRFSVADASWAESAPLARFRVRGRALYALGSTASGVHVDRYDLG